MNDDEVNYTIHKFMNSNNSSYKEYRVYTKSLDALVPVWEKLKSECGTEMIMGIQIFDYNGKPWNCEFETREVKDKLGNTGVCIEHPSTSAFESAAYATAKAILELKNE